MPIPNQTLDLPPEEQEQPNQPRDLPAEEPEQPNNPVDLPDNPPVPMANTHLNWSHFKPDFSGKPEDVEVHLLRTNNWMNTHQFPDDQKVRRFCLTLLGEARLWYETLNAQQFNWAGLKEHFRQQYSKFGNTREQYFHAWRSFHFDEATDTIDGYIHKVKQVAALLNYGDPQILELFKNTLPSRLYYMLYQIGDFRMAVETVKRLLTKEQMDKKSGQSTASPFMKTKSESSKNKNEKKVSFSPVENIERTSNSIERLASLMDKMDTKLDRRDNQYRPRIHQGRGKGHGYRQNNYRPRNRSYSRDCYQYNYRGRGNYSGNRNNRNYRSNYRDSIRSRDRNNYRDGNRYNNRSNYRRDSSNQRYRNRDVSQDHGRSRERERDRSSSRESSNSRGGNQNNRDQSRNGDMRQDRNNTRDRESGARSKSRSRSSSHVSTNRDRCRCYRCNEYDHFARECPNRGTDGSSDEMGMLDQDETYALNYAEGEDFDMNLNM